MNKIFWGNKTVGRDLALLTMVVIVLSTVGVAENTAVSPFSLDIEDKSEYDMGTVGPILLYEGFEDGIMPPPGGWMVTGAWEIVNASENPGLVHTGDYAALVNWNIDNQDGWLISPEIDLTGNLETVNLSFWANTSYYTSQCNVYVYVDIGDGVNHKVWDMLNDEPDWKSGAELNQFYREVDLDISEFIGNITRIKWHYEGHSLFFPFALDDIFVYDPQTPPLPDIATGEIIGGYGGFGKGGIVSVEILNRGIGNVKDVEWNISVKGGLFGLINISSNGTIAELPEGGSEIVQTTKPIRGYGEVNITVVASEPHYGSSDTKTIKGFVFLCYVFINDS